MTVWKVNRYFHAMQGWIEGKSHAIDSSGEKTKCGKLLAENPGTKQNGDPDCKTCTKSIASDQRAEEWRLEYEKRMAERAVELRLQQEQREAEDREWWRKYNEYLRSPTWRLKSAAVRKRNPICESCGESPSAQAHHLTYAHVFNEPLFDLRAVCIPCHERITDLDRARRANRGR